MLQGACRYTDLLGGLPGIATNLLASRLRDLEAAGVVYREDARPPIATTLFGLTPRGQALKPVLLELIGWGAELMIPGPAEGDAFRGHWLAAPVQLYLADQAPDGPKVTIELRSEGHEPVTLEVSGGEVGTRPGSAEDPELTIAGPPQLILGLLSGMLEVDAAKSLGLRCEGDLEILRRLRGPAGQPADRPVGAAEGVS